jgi:chemotaxis protein methyltransferase CheR
MNFHEDSISPRDYARLCNLIYQEAGIHLSVEKKTMLEGRIKRRLKVLNLVSYRQYCDYLFDGNGRKAEVVPLIDVVTTNKTDFFREPRHFEFLAREVLPELMGHTDARGAMFWSAGCSTGEEAYTLGIVLSEFAQTHPGFRFHILASDISTVVLDKAELGVYAEETASAVPLALRRKYFLRGRDPQSCRVRVVPDLRRLIEFRRLNLMDPDYGLDRKVDVIFFRNVMIYFDRPTQQQILKKLCMRLAPGGHLFVGHAETLHDLDLPLVPIAPSLYRRSDGSR